MGYCVRFEGGSVRPPQFLHRWQAVRPEFDSPGLATASTTNVWPSARRRTRQPRGRLPAQDEKPRPGRSYLHSTSELHAALERYHTRRTVSAQSHTQQPGRRRCREAERSESGLRRWFARYPGVPQHRKSEIRVVEDVEELAVDPQLDALGQREPPGEIQIAPDEIEAAQGVAAEIAESAVSRTVSGGTGTGARVDGRSERIGVEPLDGARLSHPGDGAVLVQRHSGNHAGVLRAAALHDTLPVGRIGRAQHRKRQAAMKECRA